MRRKKEEKRRKRKNKKRKRSNMPIAHVTGSIRIFPHFPTDIIHPTSFHLHSSTVTHHNKAKSMRISDYTAIGFHRPNRHSNHDRLWVEGDGRWMADTGHVTLNWVTNDDGEKKSTLETPLASPNPVHVMLHIVHMLPYLKLNQPPTRTTH